MLDLEALLTQRDDTRDRLILAWGKLSAQLTASVVVEIEGLAHELDLLTKLHLHAISDGKLPASLVSLLTEITAQKKTRSDASASDSALLTLGTPEDDFAALRAPQSEPDSAPPSSAI